MRKTDHCAELTEDASLVGDYGSAGSHYCAVWLTIANSIECFLTLVAIHDLENVTPAWCDNALVELYEYEDGSYRLSEGCYDEAATNSLASSQRRRPRRCWL
jgi:hypothetical protein